MSTLKARKRGIAMTETDWKKIQAEFAEPFSANDIEWRISMAGESSVGKPYARVLAYLTNRAIQSRLDAVVGVGAWCNHFQPGPQGGVLCGIEVYGVIKWDGADNTAIEAIKGGISDSMKRAAVQWGIGRYLYAIPESWAECSINKESGKEWRYQKGRGGKYASFYWRPPYLPPEFLPAGETTVKHKATPEKPDAGVEELTDHGGDFSLMSRADMKNWARPFKDKMTDGEKVEFNKLYVDADQGGLAVCCASVYNRINREG